MPCFILCSFFSFQNGTVPDQYCVLIDEDYEHHERPAKRKVSNDSNDSNDIWRGVMYQCDVEALKNSKPLSDAVMDTAMNLIKLNAGVVGLQPIFHGCHMDFRKAIHPGMHHIQIHHTGTFHWVTTARTLPEKHVRLYDSLPGGDLPPFLREQLACIYAIPDEHELDVVQVPVQTQQGGVDCGAFAIAFAVELSLGRDPSNVHFNQRKMRRHLLSCIEAGKMKPFPRHRTPATTSERRPFAIDTGFCICGMPVTFDKNILCIRCSRWFHQSCAGRSDNPDDDWTCWKCRGRTPPSVVLRPKNRGSKYWSIR